MRPVSSRADDQRRAGERLERRDVRDRAPAVDRRDRSSARRPRRSRPRGTRDRRRARLERIAEPLVRIARAREHEQAAGRQIDAMDEVDLAELALQLVEQIAAIALGRRRGDEARGLVDDDHVRVGVHDRRRERGGLDRASIAPPIVDLDRLPRARPCGRDLDPRRDRRTRRRDRSPRAPCGATARRTCFGHDLIEAQARRRRRATVNFVALHDSPARARRDVEDRVGERLGHLFLEEVSGLGAHDLGVGPHALEVIDHATEDRIAVPHTSAIGTFAVANTLWLDRELRDRRDGSVAIGHHPRERERRGAIGARAQRPAIRLRDVAADGRAIALRQVQDAERKPEPAKQQVARDRQLREPMEQRRLELRRRRTDRRVAEDDPAQPRATRAPIATSRSGRPSPAPRGRADRERAASSTSPSHAA